jgi:hypothetical protein
MSLMLILITRAASVLKQFSKARQQPSGVWIVNRSKHSSFRPEVIQEGRGLQPSLLVARVTVLRTGPINDVPLQAGSRLTVRQ